MDSKQILEKAIQKAIDGGWTHERIPVLQTSAECWSNQDYRTFVYRHDFAKALWGEEVRVPINQGFDKVTKLGWKRHLQAMVVSEDPIAYLGDNL